LKKEDITFENYSVEDFAQLILIKEESVISLYKKIKSSSFNKENIQRLLKNIKILEVRLNENLNIKKIILCILVPSRKIFGLFNVFDPHNELKKGYKKKVNQYYLFSILGNLLYLLIFLSFIILNKF